MTIDEKLQHFYDVSIEEAKEDAAKEIQEHRESLSQMLNEHKDARRQGAEAEIKQKPIMSAERSTKLLQQNRSH